MAPGGFVLAADIPSLLLLALVGALAAGINSVAGGGSLISFPYLNLTLGIEPKLANATNAVGLWPGSFAGALGFRERIHRTKGHLRVLILPTLAGSVAGAGLLLVTRDRVFSAVVPVLMLAASLLLAFQPQIKGWALTHRMEVSPGGVVILQFLVSVYGGYFGAGMGIMMLACFTLYMPGDIHDINAVKSWLGLIINLVASLVFATQGLVLATPAGALIAGSLVGGFFAARLSLRLATEPLRIGIAIYGFAASAYFAWISWFA